MKMYLAMVLILAAMLYGCGEEKNSVKELMDSKAVFGKYKSDLGNVKELEFKRDSTFWIIAKVGECGEVRFTGKWKLSDEWYEIHDKDFSTYKELFGDEWKWKSYRYFSLKFDDNVSSADCPGNAVLGMPYHLNKPGSCGSRDYLGLSDKLLIQWKDVQGKDTPDFGSLVIVEHYCQESSGKRYQKAHFMEKN